MAREFSKKFYDSKEWKATREYILLRDHYLCVNCGAPATEVHHVIHLTPQNINDNRINMNPNNLVSLCRECHQAEHRADQGKGKVKDGADIEYNFRFDENGQLIRCDAQPPSKNF